MFFPASKKCNKPPDAATREGRTSSLPHPSVWLLFADSGCACVFDRVDRRVVGCSHADAHAACRGRARTYARSRPCSLRVRDRLTCVLRAVIDRYAHAHSQTHARTCACTHARTRTRERTRTRTNARAHECMRLHARTNSRLHWPGRFSFACAYARTSTRTNSSCAYARMPPRSTFKSALTFLSTLRWGWIMMNGRMSGRRGVGMRRRGREGGRREGGGGQKSGGGDGQKQGRSEWEGGSHPLPHAVPISRGGAERALSALTRGCKQGLGPAPSRRCLLLQRSKLLPQVCSLLVTCSR